MEKGEAESVLDAHDEIFQNTLTLGQLKLILEILTAVLDCPVQGLKETDNCRGTDRCMEFSPKEGEQYSSSLFINPRGRVLTDFGEWESCTLKFMQSKILIQEVKSCFCCGAHLFALAGRGWDGNN